MNTFTHEIKAIYIIWLREVIRYWRNKIRAVSGLAMPILWLVVMGGGLSSSLSFTPGGNTNLGFNYVNFIFPGILAMNILFSSVFAGVSIVYDREFGFFKEIFVAPISRTSIVFGKILGGATTATVQASLMFLITPIIGVKLPVSVMILLLPIMFLVAFAMSSIGVLLASFMRSTETFPMVMQFIMMPMFFLSGALFPLRNAPAWLSSLAHFNPLTYGVNALRTIFLTGAEVPKSIIESLTITLFGKDLTIYTSLSIVVVLTAVVVVSTVISFKYSEK